ncbi:hypothetical protein AWC38_SpisGene18635 [Stylophora pistillata]|uniref:Reverse transcriptase domain-containing protein n=1 Tax=Stylophora pistillata TaxID=50429 RepID=A0A2B4RJR4_STYPI|nr:hypothetical protein AWC38_SpisGene18635 [Stylophora pistillata]
MVRVFYDDFNCAVEDQGETCEWFDIKTSVKQGCNMSGFLFLIVMDWVMQRAVGSGENGIRWKFTSKLDDLDFAYDIVLLSSTKQQIQDKTTRLDEEARQVPTKDPPNPMARRCQHQRATGKGRHEATECGSDVS